MDKVRALNRLVGSLPHGCVVGNFCVGGFDDGAEVHLFYLVGDIYSNWKFIFVFVKIISNKRVNGQMKNVSGGLFFKGIMN